METILFRCSSLGKLMTEPRSKSEELSETTKAYLTEKFVNIKYGRQKDIANRYTIKGLAVEEDSITIYSKFRKKFFNKNETRLSNDFICGTPDLYEGETIEAATHIIDLKSSWDIFTYYNTRNGAIDKAYYWQLQGYMALTGAKSATLAYCLVNTPDVLVNDEKRRLMWKMGVATEDNPNVIEAFKEIEKLSVYDDIDFKERVLETPVERNDSDIERLYDRIVKCRAHIQKMFNH